MYGRVLNTPLITLLNTLLHKKHLTPNITDDEVLISEEKSCVHPAIYETIGEDFMKCTTLKTRKQVQDLTCSIFCWM